MKGGEACSDLGTRIKGTGANTQEEIKKKCPSKHADTERDNPIQICYTWHLTAAFRKRISCFSPLIPKEMLSEFWFYNLCRC